MKQDITPEVAARGIVDYQRMFSGYDILSATGVVNETTIFSEYRAALSVLINCILDRNPPSIRCHIYL